MYDEHVVLALRTSAAFGVDPGLFNVYGPQNPVWWAAGLSRLRARCAADDRLPRRRSSAEFTYLEPRAFVRTLRTPKHAQ